MCMCDERTYRQHTGLCRPLLFPIFTHSFPTVTMTCSSEDISCSVRPLKCFRFVPEPCSGFPFEILLTETLLQGTFRMGQGWSRHLVDVRARFFAFPTSRIHSFRPGGPHIEGVSPRYLLLQFWVTTHTLHQM